MIIMMKRIKMMKKLRQMIWDDDMTMILILIFLFIEIMKMMEVMMILND